MARTLEQWNNLSPTYRARLTKAGVSRKQYMEGKKLQEARGQKIEAKRSEVREKLKRAGKPVPSESTVRAWKRRAVRRGVKPADFDDARQHAGFVAVQNKIRELEERNQAWREAKRPNKKARLKDTSYGDTMAAIDRQAASRESASSGGYYGAGSSGGSTGDSGYDLDTDYGEDAYDYEDLLYYEDYDQDYDWPDSWGYYH